MELSIEQITHIYNMGYNTGHNDTVESQASPAHYLDMETYRLDVVEEILEDIRDKGARDECECENLGSECNSCETE